jgi:hypothetical protein
MNTTPSTSALEIFQSLAIPDLEARLQAIAEEERAIRTLLRALKAKERARRFRKSAPQGKETPNA